MTLNKGDSKLDDFLNDLELSCDMAKLEQRLSQLGGEPKWCCDTAKLDELLKGGKNVALTRKPNPPPLTEELPSNLDELLKGANAAFPRKPDPPPLAKDLPSNLDELLEGGKNVPFPRKPDTPPLTKEPSTAALPKQPRKRAGALGLRSMIAFLNRC